MTSFYITATISLKHMDSSWKPISKASLAVGVIAAIAFWIHALADDDGFLLLDYVNLPFHEFGHVLFGILGYTIGIWGGTITQLAVPLIILISFWLKREPSGTAFSAFWFGESILYSSVYISDAQNMFLPLAGGGEHDWNILLSGMNMLRIAETIGAVVKIIGWLIMVSSIVWFVTASLRQGQE